MTTKPTKRLIIVGAGSLARELASWVQPGRGELTGYQLAGFLSDDPSSLKDYPQYSPGIIGSVAGFTPLPDDLLLMGISQPVDKLRIAAELEAKGGRFHSLVHESVLVANWVKLGRGVVLCPNVVVSCHAEIGDFATINLGSTIGHDVKLARGATLSAHVDLTGFVAVGEGAFFGSHAAVVPKVKVGEYSRVGAGSVVLRTVKPGSTVMGVPAKQITP